MTQTEYVLVDKTTGARLPYPNRFKSLTAAGLFAIVHDLRGWEVEPVLPNETTPLLPLIYGE